MTVEDSKAALIIHNDDHMLKGLESLLTKEGFHTRATWSGHEALALLKSRPFELVLMGDYIADLHSADLVRRVRKNRKPPRTIVLQSNVPTPFERRRYRSLGADAVVSESEITDILQLISRLR